MLGCRKGVSLGRIGHDDALSGRCVHIDIIHADTGTPDKLQFLACLDHLRVDFGAAPHEQGIVIPDDPAELVFLEVGLDSTSLPAEDGKPFFRQRIADEHSCVCHKNPYIICADLIRVILIDASRI